MELPPKRIHNKEASEVELEREIEILNNKAVEQAKRLEILERKVDAGEAKGWIDHLF